MDKSYFSFKFPDNRYKNTFKKQKKERGISVSRKGMQTFGKFRFRLYMVAKRWIVLRSMDNRRDIHLFTKMARESLGSQRTLLREGFLTYRGLSNPHIQTTPL